MVKILDNIMIKVMMAVLTLSWAFDASASGSRSYFEYNGLCYKTFRLYYSHNASNRSKDSILSAFKNPPLYSFLL